MGKEEFTKGQLVMLFMGVAMIIALACTMVPTYETFGIDIGCNMTRASLLNKFIGHGC